ncbi:MAG: DUF1501 domain-containing protein [Myxococcales bacterium]|nr:DUF1501 domain-containing protein [Myxococcales bacterium]
MASSRRTFLKGLGLGVGAMMLAPWRAMPLFAAGNAVNRRYIFCYMDGGWDQLLALDPRDPATYTKSTHNIEPAYDLLPAAYPRTVLQPSGSNITFGPAIGNLQSHADKMCVVRGVQMGTLTHEVGRRYFLTGKVPRGLTAAGSSIPAHIVDQHGALGYPLPNLVVQAETYNEDLHVYASGLALNGVGDLLAVLRDGPDAPDAKMRAILAEYRKRTSCDPGRLDPDGTGVFAAVKQSADDAEKLMDADLDKHFDFGGGATQEILDLRQRYGITDAQPNSGAAQLALAFQAIRLKVAQCVTVTLANGLDTHEGTWRTLQPQLLRDAFNALSVLIDDLANTADPDQPQKKLLETTNVVVFSEFARTPMLNNRGGRDHHLANSALFFGPDVPHNRVIGATSDSGMDALKIDPDTGAPRTDGVFVTPTLLFTSLMTNANYKIDKLRVNDTLPCLRPT